MSAPPVMPTLFGFAASFGGLFLILWQNAVVSLPGARRPRFSYGPGFRWGLPTAGLLLFSVGICLLSRINPWLAAAQSAVCALALFLVLHFDRYTAEARNVYHLYREIRRAHPSMEEFEVLFHTAAWRYPSWSQDRLVELVAGKDIEGLILLMLVQENRINPLSDWGLYRALKKRTARVAGRRT